MAVQSRTEYVKDEIRRLQIVIFECRYQCRILQRDQYDVETLTNRGIPVSGVDWMDQFADEQHITRLFTIAQMCEFAEKRINFWLEEPQTYATVIYKSVTDYIALYAELSDMYPNLPIPDQEDFESLDQLATNLFRLHRCYETEIELKGFLGRLRQRRRSFSLSDYGMTKPAIQLGNDGEVQQREHVSNLELLGHRYRPRKEPENGD